MLEWILLELRIVQRLLKLFSGRCDHMLLSVYETIISEELCPAVAVFVFDFLAQGIYTDKVGNLHTQPIKAYTMNSFGSIFLCH